MIRTQCVFVLALLLVVGCAPSAPASPATSLFSALARYASKEAVGESAEKITKEVGEEVVERVARGVLREGSEETLENVTKLVAKHGPDVIRALDNAPSMTPLLKALDDLPADQVPKAAARLAAGASGKELAEATIRHGSSALKAELAHPGVGGRIVAVFGDDGASLCGKLDTDEVIAFGRYVDDVASASPSQRNELLQVINDDKDRFFRWLADFAEKNPGKTIGSATFLAVFLPNAERILGGAEIIYDKDGNPKGVRKPGWGEGPDGAISGPVREGMSWLTRGLAVVVVGAVAVFAAIKLLGTWRRLG